MDELNISDIITKLVALDPLRTSQGPFVVNPESVKDFELIDSGLRIFGVPVYFDSAVPIGRIVPLQRLPFMNRNYLMNTRPRF